MEIEKMGTNILFEFFYEGKKERDGETRWEIVYIFQLKHCFKADMLEWKSMKRKNCSWSAASWAEFRISCISF